MCAVVLWQSQVYCAKLVIESVAGILNASDLNKALAAVGYEKAEEMLDLCFQFNWRPPSIHIEYDMKRNTVYVSDKYVRANIRGKDIYFTAEQLNTLTLFRDLCLNLRQTYPGICIKSKTSDNGHKHEIKILGSLYNPHESNTSLIKDLPSIVKTLCCKWVNEVMPHANRYKDIKFAIQVYQANLNTDSTSSVDDVNQFLSILNRSAVSQFMCPWCTSSVQIDTIRKGHDQSCGFVRLLDEVGQEEFYNLNLQVDMHDEYPNLDMDMNYAYEWDNDAHDANTGWNTNLENDAHDTNTDWNTNWENDTNTGWDTHGNDANDMDIDNWSDESPGIKHQTSTPDPPDLGEKNPLIYMHANNQRLFMDPRYIEFLVYRIRQVTSNGAGTFEHIYQDLVDRIQTTAASGFGYRTLNIKLPYNKHSTLSESYLDNEVRIAK